MELVEKKVGTIESINTRDKRYGSGYNMSIRGAAGKYVKKGSDDPFIRLFQLNCALRNSCFACPMKRMERVSDITIGDFQKAQQYYPQYEDGKGVSVVLINTEKGCLFFESALEKLDCQVVDMASARQVNLYTQILDCSKRELFFAKLKNEPFLDVLKKFTTLGLKNKMIYLLKGFVKKCIGR